VGAALVVHLGAVGALTRIHVAWQPPPAPPVEFELRSPPPPPPPIQTPEPPPPPKAAEPPPPVRVVPRRLAPAEPPPAASPPPPNQEPPPEAPKNAPPVFGVTMSSVVSGESGAAVPVGNTLMAKPSAPRPTDKPAEPYAGGSQPFRPVPDVYIATGPKALFKVEGEEVYPADARAVGLEGVVKLSVDLNEKGVVVGVKVIERAGHGFDEAAVKAMRQFRYRPALASDGRPVPCRFAYTYRFSMGD